MLREVTKIMRLVVRYAMLHGPELDVCSAEHREGRDRRPYWID